MSFRKALMLTEDFASPNGKTFAYVAVRPNGTVEFGRDGSAPTGIETVDSTGAGLVLPIWLRMVRIHSYQDIRAYYKTTLNGNWIQIGNAASIYGSITGPLEVGLFACSRNIGATVTAVFDDFQGGTRINNSGYDLSFAGTGSGADVNSVVTADLNTGSLDFTGYAGAFDFGRINGLAATYYDRLSFWNNGITRVDPDINFTWGSASPDPSLILAGPSNEWSSRW